jgi:hypothetical protein
MGNPQDADGEDDQIWRVVANILSRVLVTEIGFGLVIGFINRLQVVTTKNYCIVPDLHNLQITPH